MAPLLLVYLDSGSEFSCSALLFTRTATAVSCRFGQIASELAFQLLPQQSHSSVEIFVLGLGKQLTIGDPDFGFNDEC